jgi:hypothetical protein
MLKRLTANLEEQFVEGDRLTLSIRKSFQSLTSQ